ncbi:GNAT family N-acetyltransferase [Lentilactobacillus kosonis]|uniref:Phosphinothricin N-acetyltransferase n=1 Tax=Lentilactobacillus kosonis TaxID=2810561 RepID=A0A401FNJ9_9LACO|nr:GNAT family N-acetyltransferase [Lentilactobacillus kosonis]GAY73923.1 phosphinothricin N-acetyltransferase [Lentilactobacillus kosonis]
MIEFVNAKESDLPFIVDVYNATIPSRMATGDVEPVSVADREPWFHSHSEDQRPLFVIKVAGQSVGWVSLNDFYDRDSYRKLAEISIYIHPDFRHQHIGSQTLTFIDEHVKDYDIDSIVSLVFGHNAPSLGLFKAHGYEPWGLLPKIAEMDDKKYDLVILGKHF